MEEARAATKSKVRQRRERLIESIEGKIGKLNIRLAKKEEMLAKARKDSSREAYTCEIDKIKEEIRLAEEALAATLGASLTQDR